MKSSIGKFSVGLLALVVITIVGVPSVRQAAAFAAALALNEATFVEAAPNLSRNSNESAASVDLIDYDGYIALTLMSTAGAGTTPNMSAKLQQSSDNGVADAWTDVTSGAWTVVTDAADAHETLVLNSNGMERYIHVYWGISGTSPAFTFGTSMVGFKDQR